MTARTGRFVTLEGIEGAGKSTVATALVSSLQSQGISCRLTREPGGTPAAERIRAVLLTREIEALTPLAETLLMFAARAEHVATLIAPALARGEWVICDRYTDASRAYQGAGRGVERSLIESLAVAAQHGHVPDLTLLFDLPVEVGLARARARSPGIDRFEAESSRFFGRVRAQYLDLARAEPDRFVVIDATLPPAEVLAAALGAIARKLTR